MPENLTEVSVQASKRSEVATGLRRALAQRQIAVVPYSDGTPVIEVGQEKLDRRILSLTPSGQVAEYEFIYTLPIRFVHASGQAQEQTIELSRDYQDDPNFALAKTREFELVIREMRSDAVQRALILMNQYLRD
ncbi:LPS assembly lipoprotein LptE [Aliidiomarina taiwanensis]|uniref:LPS-assembly lipoprotein LptE n=1 Tax=Aliidiomarina taiwanensis TaxID=946228 RepID=UPI001300B074|nr:LPS assembly lipoprotein LptE [Aliidiomarina taiwanensis]